MQMISHEIIVEKDLTHVECIVILKLFPIFF